MTTQRLNLNSTARQLDSTGELIQFRMCCTAPGCAYPHSRALPTSWAANKAKANHNRQYGHKATVQTAVAELAAGTKVIVTKRGNITGTVVEHIGETEFGDTYLIDFGKGRTGYNTRDQITVASS